MKEIQPAWTRSFLDEEEPCVIHVIKSGHRHTEKHKNLFIVIREDPYDVNFIGLIDAAEINNRFNIIL